MIIENKPGAAGVIGTDLVAKAAPDGHTLLMVAGSLTVLAATSPKLPYDTERDLVPMGQALVFSNAMAALNCTKLGARGGIATVAEAKALIERGERRANKDYALLAQSA